MRPWVSNPTFFTVNKARSLGATGRIQRDRTLKPPQGDAEELRNLLIGVPTSPPRAPPEGSAVRAGDHFGDSPVTCSSRGTLTSETHRRSGLEDLTFPLCPILTPISRRGHGGSQQEGTCPRSRAVGGGAWLDPVSQLRARAVSQHRGNFMAGDPVEFELGQGGQLQTRGDGGSHLLGTRECRVLFRPQT